VHLITMQHMVVTVAEPVHCDEFPARLQATSQAQNDFAKLGGAKVVTDLAENNEVELLLWRWVGDIALNNSYMGQIFAPRTSKLDRPRGNIASDDMTTP
jgi:hypothetical protein